MRILFYIIIIAFVGFASCAKVDKIKVRGVEGVELHSPTKLDITLDMENASSHNVQLSSAKFTLRYMGHDVVDMLLATPVSLPRKSAGPIVILLRLRASDPLVLLSMSATGLSDMSGYTVSGVAVVKSGIARKKIELRDKPVSEILSIFTE